MLKEAMLAMRVTDMDFAPDLCRLLKSAEQDLKIAGVVIQGTCVFVITETTDQTTGETTITVTDNSTIVDELVITAVSVWCNMRIGNPPNYDKLLEAYNSLKGQMRLSSAYRGGGGTCDN